MVINQEKVLLQWKYIMASLLRLCTLTAYNTVVFQVNKMLRCQIIVTVTVLNGFHPQWIMSSFQHLNELCQIATLKGKELTVLIILCDYVMM